MSLADNISAARRDFADGAREGTTPASMKARMEALTDLLWDNLDEIEAALRAVPPPPNADAQWLEAFPTLHPTVITEGEKARLRMIARRLRGAL